MPLDSDNRMEIKCKHYVVQSRLCDQCSLESVKGVSSSSLISQSDTRNLENRPSKHEKNCLSISLVVIRFLEVDIRTSYMICLPDGYCLFSLFSLQSYLSQLIPCCLSLLFEILINSIVVFSSSHWLHRRSYSSFSFLWVSASSALLLPYSIRTRKVINNKFDMTFIKTSIRNNTFKPE